MAGERAKQSYFSLGGGAPQDSPGQGGTPVRRLRQADTVDATPGSAQKQPRRASAPTMINEGGGALEGKRRLARKCAGPLSARNLLPVQCNVHRELQFWANSEPETA